jgi:predicted glycosyltransferase
MAGYNTVVEELAAAAPSLLVPRCHPRVEQHIRSARLAAVSDTLHHCPIEDLSPTRISRFIAEARNTPRGPCTLDLEGVGAVARRLSASSRPSREPSHA